MRSALKTNCLARPTGLAASFSGPSFVGLLSIDPALASQGPGVAQGTATGFTQMAMAILVYGAAALVIGAGLIGAIRRH